MAKIGQKRDGRSHDFEFTWLVKAYGEQWQPWATFAAEWLATQHRATNFKRKALAHFFESYLVAKAPYTANVDSLFTGNESHRCSSEEFVAVISQSILANDAHAKYLNYVVIFIEWLITTHYSTQSDNGALLPTVSNPFSKQAYSSSRTETVRNPLPYRYIQELRKILCPVERGSFKDWAWAHNKSGQAQTQPLGDWFDVDYEAIDHGDPDCVWRTRTIKRKGKEKEIYQLWSPVKAMVILVKLLLPLRTYQVRMLDSGEADTWRYISGDWAQNTAHGFAIGNTNKPFAQGVFKRIYDSFTGSFLTGLYINTNKTADQNKESVQRGYTIPWQNEDVLYWLEKLRNWQEKYNPITEPASCTTLLPKHTHERKSKAALQEMGLICFLFRDASSTNSADRHKPITPSVIPFLWRSLLYELECQLYERGERVGNGIRLQLVKEYLDEKPEYERTATHFPLHSLRVSLLTAYTMDTVLPLPVISKLLAGHSRLLMTIYYNKITPSVMAEKMAEAHQELEGKASDSLRAFIKDAELSQIQQRSVSVDDESMQMAIATRNPIGWEPRALGLCLVGGNTVKSDEVSTIGGCWNGGELSSRRSNATTLKIYEAVPHGPENCVRCRWFTTDASYLPALNAHFNFTGYQAHQAAQLAQNIEVEKEALEDEKYFAETAGKLFLKHAELQRLQRRFEAQLTEADEFTKDWIATFNLISRIIKVEEQRTPDDQQNKLIAVGDTDTVSHSLKFIEVNSELLHLSLLCEDAEFYPDLRDKVLKTGVITKRSMNLCRILMQKSFKPVFMEMDEIQQLIAGNAMLRQMAKISDPANKLEGYRKAVSYLETAQFLEDSELLEQGMASLPQQPTTIPLFQRKQSGN